MSEESAFPCVTRYGYHARYRWWQWPIHLRRLWLTQLPGRMGKGKMRLHSENGDGFLAVLSLCSGDRSGSSAGDGAYNVSRKAETVASYPPPPQRPPIGSGGVARMSS